MVGACYEGSVDYRTVDPDVPVTCPENTVFTLPIYEYDHSAADCTVIGGYVYRGQQYAKLYGRYVFADFCTGRMWMLTKTGNQTSGLLHPRYQQVSRSVPLAKIPMANCTSEIMRKATRKINRVISAV